MHVIALGDLRKTVFVPWESAPIWGRYGGLKIGIFDVFWHFGAIFSETGRPNFTKFLQLTDHY